VTVSRELLRGARSPQGVFDALKTEGRYGVVRGSLRVLDNARAAAP
jgi:hypothetical protein